MDSQVTAYTDITDGQSSTIQKLLVRIIRGSSGKMTFRISVYHSRIMYVNKNDDCEEHWKVL